MTHTSERIRMKPDTSSLNEQYKEYSDTVKLVWYTRELERILVMRFDGKENIPLGKRMFNVLRRQETVVENCDFLLFLQGWLLNAAKKKFTQEIREQMRTIYDYRISLVHSSVDTKDKLDPVEMREVDGCWTTLIKRFQYLHADKVSVGDIDRMNELKYQISLANGYITVG